MITLLTTHDVTVTLDWQGSRALTFTFFVSEMQNQCRMEGGFCINTHLPRPPRPPRRRMRKQRRRGPKTRTRKGQRPAARGRGGAAGAAGAAGAGQGTGAQAPAGKLIFRFWIMRSAN